MEIFSCQNIVKLKSVGYPKLHALAILIARCKIQEYSKGFDINIFKCAPFLMLRYQYSRVDYYFEYKCIAVEGNKIFRRDIKSMVSKNTPFHFIRYLQCSSISFDRKPFFFICDKVLLTIVKSSKISNSQNSL